MNLLQINLQDFDPDIAREFGGGASTLDFLGVPLFDAQSLWTTLIRFVFNLIVCWVIIHCFYYKKANRKDYYFTFIMFAAVIFLIISLMENMKMNIAYALGLFAIFGMIRYRTETIKIREMTYLFVVMGLSIVNGMALSTSYSELLIVNLLIVLIVWLLDGTKLLKHTAMKIILYDRIENTKHGKEDDLKADLIERTGLDIKKVSGGLLTPVPQGNIVHTGDNIPFKIMSGFDYLILLSIVIGYTVRQGDSRYVYPFSLHSLDKMLYDMRRGLQ